MAIEGPLKELGIHDVFQLLDLSRKTGVLRVKSDLRKNEGRVWFQSGAVLVAELTENPHPLAQLLVRAGKISEADLHRARDMQVHGDSRRIGQILIEIGAIVEKELDRQVRFQTEEVIFEMMSWHEGHFSFEEGHDVPVPQDVVTRIRTESLLMEGARRIDEWSRMESKIPHVGVIPTLAQMSEVEGGELDLHPDEWEVLSSVDGERDIRQLASLLARSEFEVAKTLFGLASAGVLTMVAPAPAGADPAGGEGAAGEDAADMVGQVQIAINVRDFERATGIAQNALRQHPQSAELHFEMARVYNVQGEYAKAEEYCRRTLRLDSLLTGAHRLLGDTLAQLGRYQDAVEWWERWLRIQEQSDQHDADVAEVRKAARAAQTLHNILRVHR